jgi:hypothetical protein
MGYLEASSPRKFLKTGSAMEIPAKISLLKDLTGTFWREGYSHPFFLRGLACWNPKLSKSRKSHCCYQTANVMFIILAGFECARQGKTRDPRSRKPRDLGHPRIAGGASELSCGCRAIKSGGPLRSGTANAIAHPRTRIIPFMMKRYNVEALILLQYRRKFLWIRLPAVSGRD